MKETEIKHLLSEELCRLKNLVKGRALPLHRHEGFKPFFIVGSGRSGTTLARRILQTSREIHIPPENPALGQAILAYRRNRVAGWNQLVNLVLSSIEFHPVFDTYEMSLRPLANRLKEIPDEKKSLALILDSFYRDHGEQSGDEFTGWGDKTPINTFIMDPIISVFPDARFVHMLRDGVDVVMSSLKYGVQPSLEHMARRWKEAVEVVDGFSKRYPERCCEVRYENLVSDPEAVMEGVCAFLETDFHPEMIHSLDSVKDMKDLNKYEHLENVRNPINSTSVGKGRREATDEQKVTIRKIIGEDLSRWGYDPL